MLRGVLSRRQGSPERPRRSVALRYPGRGIFLAACLLAMLPGPARAANFTWDWATLSNYGPPLALSCTGVTTQQPCAVQADYTNVFNSGLNARITLSSAQLGGFQGVTSLSVLDSGGGDQELRWASDYDFRAAGAAVVQITFYRAPGFTTQQDVSIRGLRLKDIDAKNIAGGQNAANYRDRVAITGNVLVPPVGPTVIQSPATWLPSAAVGQVEAICAAGEVEPTNQRGWAGYEVNNPPTSGLFMVFDAGDNCGARDPAAQEVWLSDFQFSGADFGDAPDTYGTTLAANGASNGVGSVFLGAAIDGEFDGQVISNQANGDDLDADGDDEDGVVFLEPMDPGQFSAFVATVTGGEGVLSGWVDFNGDGDFLDPGETIESDRIVSSPGPVSVPFLVPADARPGRTFARFRLTAGTAGSTNSASPTGKAGIGEVEDYLVVVGRDYGDAPDSYGTLRASSGPSNLLSLNQYMSFGVPSDGEPDGQPTAGANGDDLNLSDDEDGVFFIVNGVLTDPSVTPVELTAGSTQSIAVLLVGGDGPGGNTDAVVSGWVDWNRDGDFLDAGEAVLVNQPADGASGPTPNLFSFAVPADAVPGPTFARFRATFGAGPSTNSGSPTGPAGIGEVEDHPLTIADNNLDFGDAPDSYGTTLASDGARNVVGGVYINVPPDVDPDGQPTAGADGDDNNGTDDEGRFAIAGGQFVAGQTASFLLDVAGPGVVGTGVVSIWVDWNRNGIFDIAERVVTNQPVSDANPTFTIQVPADALPGQAITRVRVTAGTAGSPNSDSPTGLAGVGEVEDARVLVVNNNLDFGDAPDTYGTTLARNGPSHLIGSLHLGVATTDAEADGQPTAGADGDDTTGTDDEDGVLVFPLVAGQQSSVAVNVQDGSNPGTGVLSAWFDWNQDGDFLDPGERIFADLPVTGAPLPLNFPVPANAVPGPTYARIRLTESAGTNTDSPTGPAGVGEVEDYQVIINLDPTLASVSALRAYTDEGGAVQVEWTTAREVGTLGFVLERLDEALEEYVAVSDELVPALGALGAPQGGTYRQVDDGAESGGTYRYRLVEEEAWGGTRIHGPYAVTVDGAPLEIGKGRGAIGARKAASGNEELVEMAANGRFKALARKLERRPAAAAKGKGRPVKVTAAAAAGSRVRLELDADGLYEVGAADIAGALGESVKTVTRWIRRGELALSSRGVPVAWEPAAGAQGIRFHGEAPAENPYTTRNVYWIDRGAGVRMASAPAAVETAVAGQTYVASEHFEQDSFSLSSIAGTDPESDYWRWAVMIGGDIARGSFETAMALRDVAPDTAASLRLDLQSIRDVGNEVIVRVNGTELSDSVAWSGALEQTAVLSIPAGVLQDGANTLRLEARAGVGGTSFVYVDGFTLEYERFAVATGGALALTAPASGPFSIDGFAATDIAVYRLDPVPVRLSGVLVDQGVAGARASFDAVAGWRYLAVEPGGEAAPVLEARAAVGLDAGAVVDYVVITDRSLAAGAGELAAYRAAASGLRTRVVFDDDIADAVNHGMASPYNLRKFVQWAQTNWSVRYAVLAGDACNDYKGVTGLCEDLVSTVQVSTPFGLYACDGCLGDIDGDTLPDVPVGRIPAADNAVLAAYVDKLRRYEAELPVDRRVLLVADYADTAGEFAGDSDTLAEQLADDAPDVAVEKLYLDETDLQTAQDILRARLGEAGLWTNYIGHGGGTNLSKSSLLVNEDTVAIAGGSGVLSAMTCVVSLHDSPHLQSLSEVLVLDADGGPAASVGPSGLSLNELAVALNGGLLDEVFAAEHEALGDAVGETMRRSAGNVPAWMRQIYNVIGDVYLLLP